MNQPSLQRRLLIYPSFILFVLVAPPFLGRSGGQQDVSLCDTCTSSLIYYVTPLATEHKNGLVAFSSNGGETRSFDLYHRLLLSGFLVDKILATI
jgi:hypothetical protein